MRIDIIYILELIIKITTFIAFIGFIIAIIHQAKTTKYNNIFKSFMIDGYDNISSIL